MAPIIKGFSVRKIIIIRETASTISIRIQSARTLPTQVIARIINRIIITTIIT